MSTQAEIEEKLQGEDLSAWLHLWHAEQGPAKPAALQLIAAAIPFPRDRNLRALDVGCGPGDAGRAIHSRFPGSSVDFVDQNEFFAALCDAVNRRDGVGGRTLARDLSAPDWRKDLASEYDVIVAVNSLHWFSMRKAKELVGDFYESLGSGGVFLLMEPVRAAAPFAKGFEEWQKAQPSQHRHEDWVRFWSRVKSFIGHDYGFLGDPPQRERIGDSWSGMEWVGLVTGAGFGPVDVLLRDSEKVIVAGAKR